MLQFYWFHFVAIDYIMWSVTMAAATNTTNIGLSSPGEEREKLDRLLKLFDNSSVFALKDNKVIGILHF